jgi:hypothetical protein
MPFTERTLNNPYPAVALGVRRLLENRTAAAPRVPDTREEPDRRVSDRALAALTAGLEMAGPARA